MHKRIGIILMAISVLHIVVGIVFYNAALVDILNAGIINTINPPYWERDAAFWFMMFGVMLFLMGWMAHWSLAHVNHVPNFLSISLLLISVVGVMMMPASGFWLTIPVAIVMLRMGQGKQTQTMNLSA